MNLSYLAKSAKVLASIRAKNAPLVFLPIAHMRENNKRTVVRRSTDLVIEGYWRCGNHFAVYSFRHAQSKPVHVAHHFHAPAQLRLAVKWNIPAVLLIREPCEAIASATVFLNEKNPATMIEFYRLFHEAVLDLREKLIVVDFTDVVSDFGAVIDRVNAFYGTDFDRFSHTDANVAAVKDAIAREHKENMRGVVATDPLPSHEKKKRKDEIIQRLQLPEFSRVLSTCQTQYEHLAELAKAT